MDSFSTCEAYQPTNYTKRVRNHAIHKVFVLIAPHFPFLLPLGICVSAALRMLYVLNFNVEKRFEICMTSFPIFLFCEAQDQFRVHKIRGWGEILLFDILLFVPTHHQTRFEAFHYSFFVSLHPEYKVAVQYSGSFWSLYYFSTMHVIQGTHFLIHCCFALGSFSTHYGIFCFTLVITVSTTQCIDCEFHGCFLLPSGIHRLLISRWGEDALPITCITTDVLCYHWHCFRRSRGFSSSRLVAGPELFEFRRILGQSVFFTELISELSLSTISALRDIFFHPHLKEDFWL